jgi:hypothetical protein
MQFERDQSEVRQIIRYRPEKIPDPLGACATVTIGVPPAHELPSGNVNLEHVIEIQLGQELFDVPFQVDLVDYQVVEVEQDSGSGLVAQSIEEPSLSHDGARHLDIDSAVL